MPSTIELNKLALVFTDFDGTLLDHHTYSYEAALPCLRKLNSLGIPVIPNTSKTFAEVTLLQKEMQLDTPLIVENGAAVYIPKDALPEKPRGAIWLNGYWVKTFAQKRSYWQGIIKKIKGTDKELYETFGEMNISRICELTDLDEESASLSAQRQFGEPILWKGSPEQRDEFLQVARNLGAHPLIGGRFLHICGDSNKGKAMLWLVNEYRRQLAQTNISSIALGDGNNDIDMLEVADTAVRISSPIHSPPILQRKHNVYTSVATGPQGWREVMEQLIPELNKGA